MVNTVLRIEGMMCEKCSGKVETALSSVKGVSSAAIDLKKGTATVEHSGVSDEDLAMAVIDAGFKAKVKRGLLG